MPQHSLLRPPVPLDHACAVAAQHASSAHKRCALADEVLDALIAAGFARHFVPREQGGQHGTFLVLDFDYREGAGLVRRTVGLDAR